MWSRWHGASGFLEKKIAECDNGVSVNNSMNKDWDAFSKLCSRRTSMEDITLGKKHWTSIYLANTPQQAAELGLKFAGVDEVAPEYTHRLVDHIFAVSTS